MIYICVFLIISFGFCSLGASLYLLINGFKEWSWFLFVAILSIGSFSIKKDGFQNPKG